MKTVKRTTIAILILTLLFSLAVPTMAANLTGATNSTITIASKSDIEHTYGAYQIFSGTIESEKFVNPEWGESIDGPAFLQALKDDTTFNATFDGCNTASDVIKILGGFTSNSPEMNLFAKIAGGHLNDHKNQSTFADNTYTIHVPTGYYLVKDDVDMTDENDSETMYILDLTQTNEAAIAPKSNIPTVVKKVEEDKELPSSVARVDGNYYNDVADWDIGQEKSFRLYATIPEDAANMAGYESYKIVFNDKYSDGIDVNLNGFTATYTTKAKAEPTTITAAFGTPAHNTDGNTITFTCENLLASGVMSKEDFLDNPTIVITYKATLNENAKIGPDEGNINTVNLQFSNDVYGAGLGKTPDDTVIVFTYEIDATKIDGDTAENETPTSLAGAEFKLMNSDKTQYAVVENGKFVRWDTAENASTLTSADSTGKITIQGLDADTYYLEEIKAPEGYNKLTSPLELVITSAKGTDPIYQQAWDTFIASDAITTVNLSVDGTDTTDFKIANYSGFTLPETGGMGTTLLYIIGSILVIGAGVILIAKKRMSNQD